MSQASGEYRIEELARLAGTTTRNIRVYRDRGLLHPPLRVGRIALFNDTHLTRLRLITSMLDRGYNIAHVHEMLSAWEQGKNLGDMLGLESAIAGSWAAEKPERMPLADAKRLVDDDAAFDRMVGLGDHPHRRRRGNGGAAQADRGVQRDPAVRRQHRQAHRHPRADGPARSTRSAGSWCEPGVEHVLTRINPGAALPPDTEVAELITMLVRFRTQAVAAVSATLAFSIESTIEIGGQSDPRRLHRQKREPDERANRAG